ncbi:multiple epidermal growth factor-like domains protein 10 [Mercenaria mercenaria]|uniref:multiple epidermal growth factor-like domains protein 10 n=1 Tax=Mercenaria mercenaria TaxID=6596 RepID=UPI00234F21BB|nr:multiple epidermal growth factor-like domains protein 10 [Mercenaria mercenaria]
MKWIYRAAILYVIVMQYTLSELNCKIDCACCKDRLCSKLSHYANTCTKGCIDGYRGARCYIKCASNCKACDKNNASNCTKCHDDFLIGNGTTCTKECLARCKSCSDFNVCTECQPGFYNTANTSNCPHTCPSMCEECSSSHDCSTCAVGRYNGHEYDSPHGLLLNNCTYKCNAQCRDCISYRNCTICVKGMYGYDCQQKCSEGCTQGRCEQETGQCLCKKHFTGDRCSDCVTGKYGNFCEIACPLNCKNNSCDRQSGYCSFGCESDNFTGQTCTECTDGKYGDICNKTCPYHCKGSVCNRQNGKCCKANYNGPKCDECVTGQYGPKCSEICPHNCDSGKCGNISGYCFKCKGNYFGNICDKCKIGFYGITCQYRCPLNCHYDVCDRVSGNCLAGCKNNFSGNKCCLNSMHCENCLSDIECNTCVPGFYGDDCQNLCQEKCAASSCDRKSGTCLYIISDHSMSLDLVAIVVPVSGIVLVALTALLVILLRRKGFCHRQRNIQQQTPVYFENLQVNSQINDGVPAQTSGNGSVSDGAYDTLEQRIAGGGTTDYVNVIEHGNSAAATDQ